MKIVFMVMAIVDVNGKEGERVTCSLGLAKDSTFQYLGSITCTFEQFGFIHSVLKLAPDKYLEYKPQKWTAYLDKLREELIGL